MISVAANGSEEAELIERAGRYGIEPSYIDAFGSKQAVSVATLRNLLSIMGIDTSSDGAALRDIDARMDRLWTGGVEPVTLVLEGRRAIVSVAYRSGTESSLYRWKLLREDGRLESGAFTPRTRFSAESKTIDGVKYERSDLDLGFLPLGYHQLEIGTGDAFATARIIVAPARCYLPPSLERGSRVWGIAVQLYALTSETNFGIGNLGDLEQLVAATGGAGGSLVGISPLHDVDILPGETPSPYSPRSRLDISPLYLDVRALPGFKSDGSSGAALDAARSSTFIDYNVTSTCVEQAIDTAFAAFETEGVAELRRAFDAFVARGGAMLRQRAIFAVLARHFRADVSATDWRQWPRTYHDPASPDVAAFAIENASEIRRALYVQWQADVQLARAAGAGPAMPIGLYRDVAVGARAGGAETWLFGKALRAEASIGAPPDVLNRAGQNWGVVPFDPVGLRAAGYAPFAELLRANMRHAGAIRIDHVMALARLWWVPEGASAADGAYVRYRLDELLAIVALESRRSRCLVIGEDLGTVPTGFRETLAERCILSYRLFTFEVDADGRHVAPEDYPSLALVSSSTHDLAPIAAHVSGHDIAMRESIELLDAGGAADARASRSVANERLFDALAAAGTPAKTIERWRAKTTFDKRERERIVDAVAAFLAKTPSAILILPLEDVLGDLDQPNVPTTVDEHPNWRRRASATVEEIVSHRRLAELADVLERRSASHASTGDD